LDAGLLLRLYDAAMGEDVRAPVVGDEEMRIWEQTLAREEDE